MPKISAHKKDQRRRQILHAAERLFAENGFHQTGMADIVAASGLSRGAVYLYFAGKDDLIEALADDRHAAEAALNLAAGAADEPVEALHALVRVYARALTAEEGGARRRVSVNGWAEALRNPRVHGRVVEGLEAPLRLIGDLVRRGQAGGRVARDLDAEAVARALVAMFQGFVLQASWGERIDIDASLAALDRMIDGLMVRDAAS